MAKLLSDIHGTATSFTIPSLLLVRRLMVHHAESEVYRIYNIGHLQKIKSYILQFKEVDLE